MGGIFEDVPGVRREDVPGPDGYSGCGLEGLVAAQQREAAIFNNYFPSSDAADDEDTAPELLSRYMFRLEGDEIGELRSTKPLSYKDKLSIAMSLLGRVTL